jgi:hypothetical protein
MADKKHGKTAELYYAKYKTAGTHATNRAKKLQRALKKHPNNEQILAALKDIRYRRGTPKNPTWSHSMIDMAKRVKRFVGVFNKDYFSKDPKIEAAAIRTRNENIFTNFKMLPVDGSMFSLGNRARHNKSSSSW